MTVGDGRRKSRQPLGSKENKQIKNSCISKYPLQNVKSYKRNFATMKTPQAPQSESEPKRLEYRPPSVTKLGKLADLTLAVDNVGTADGGMGIMDKT
jgi:hypothetical protein